MSIGKQWHQITPRQAARVAQIMRQLAKLRRELASLASLLLLFCIVAGQGKATAAVDAGAFMGPQPCALLAAAPLEVSAKDLVMVLGALLTLGAVYAKLNGFSKDFASSVVSKVKAELVADKKVGSTTIDGQPIQVEGVVRFVAHHELDEKLGSYVTSEALGQAVQRLDEKQEANFRALDSKRSHSIGNLHEHLTGTTRSLTEKIEHASGRQHDRMEAMSTTLRGEFEAKLTELRADLGNLPGRVITLLQQTGQIGRGGKS